MTNRKQLAIKAAKEVGKILLKNYNKVNKIIKKARNNFVTNVDLECEKAVFRIIKNDTNDSILSEEEGFIDNNSDYKWIIDPLDGTHNYIHGFPIFGVSIALEYKGKITLGVLYLPKLNRFLVAEKGKGAFLNGKRIKVSNIKRLNESLMVMDSAFHKSRELKIRFLRKASKRIFRIRTSGCAIFDLTSLATGTADEYVLFQTNPWDVAAGILMIKEAGGRVTDFNGNKADHYAKQLVASNGKVHTSILKLLS